ncbi:hypothetical protein F4777DRAFT_573483 [Nemania sp. FL0916]|nr:hypothetical protein F4777DRAFT_573483 [Nemania sp. FL0916]
MKACTALPSSSARVGRRKSRHISWKPIARRVSTERRRNNASPIVAEGDAPTPFDVNSDNKTIATAIGDLPLSPIMDPSYWEATTRHQTAKATKGKAQNSVERQFRMNPFAKALASPIRQCTASQTRLPSFFLQDFNLISHPETGRPWWAPRSLAGLQPLQSQQVTASTDGDATETQGLGDEQATNDRTDRLSSGHGLEALSANAPAASQPRDPKVYGPSAYVLARQDLLSAFTTRKSGYESHTKRLFGGSSSRFARFAGESVWREDMDWFVLNQMRRGIVEDLAYISDLSLNHDRRYVVKCDSWDQVQKQPPSAVLWFQDATQLDNPEPGPFSTYNISTATKDISLPVHNMPMLLGPKFTEMVTNIKTFRKGSLFKLAKRRTVDLQLKLWKLQGYLADYKETVENNEDK